jgi:hypothetical protein
MRARKVTDRSRIVPGRTDVLVDVLGLAEAGPWDGNLTSRLRLGERPKPISWSMTNERGVTVGSAEAGPGVTARRSRSCVRPKPGGEPGSPCLDAGEGRHSPAPNEAVTTFFPRRGRRSMMPHRRVPRRNARGRLGGAGTKMVIVPHRSGFGWPQWARHGNGETKPKGL